MATAVLDLDVNHLPCEITDLDHYQHALVLVRAHGQPVGQVTVPVVNGRINGSELRNVVVDTCGWVLQEKLLHHYLEWEEVPALSPMLTATVAVCTRDRPEDLHRCLESLMHLPEDGQEYLVIDSCSSDDATYRVVQQFPKVRYVREECPGLNIARNRALREARHEIIAFCDDDAVPDPGWLRALTRNFENRLVLCVTGLTMPLELETEAQEWHERYSSFGRGFRRTIFRSELHNPMAGGLVGAGVNMAFRRRALELVGPFDEALDAGTLTYSGGDNEMFSRILAAGYHIVYEPAAISWHRHRRTWKELRRMAYGNGVGVYAAWTSSFLGNGEVAMTETALAWLRQKQLPALIRALLRQPDSVPVDLILAELRGCAAGPGAYLTARRVASRRNNHCE